MENGESGKKSQQDVESIGIIDGFFHKRLIFIVSDYQHFKLFIHACVDNA